MIRYLISYADRAGNTGSCELSIHSPIQSMDDVQALTRELVRQYGLTNPIILGFSRFEEK